MPIHTTILWKRFTLIGMLVGLLGSTLLPTSTTTGYAAQTTAGSSFEWNTPDGAGGSASFDDPGVYAEVDTANPRYDGLCSNRAYHISSTVTSFYTYKGETSSGSDVTGGLIQPVGDGSYRPYPGPYYGPITSQGARILNQEWSPLWKKSIVFPFTVSTDANASARIELYVDLHGGPARYADKPYGSDIRQEASFYWEVDYELIPVEVNAEGKVIGELPPEDATNNCGTYYEVSFYPNPLGPDALPDTGDEPIGTFGPDGLPGTDDDLPIGGGITDNPGSLRQTSGGGGPADGDGDGVPDDQDRCPYQGDSGAGVDEFGCPLRKPNSRAVVNDVSVPVRVLGVDVPFTNRRVLHTQLRLNLSEPTAGQVQMRGEFEAVQPRDNWEVVAGSDTVTCSEYTENNINRSRCTVSVKIQKPGNWQFDLNLLESPNGTPEVGVSRDQQKTVLTFQWIYRAQLSEISDIPSYSIYAVGSGDEPLFYLLGR